MSEDVFFAHTRTWHCKILISEGQDAETSADHSAGSVCFTETYNSIKENFCVEDNFYGSSIVGASEDTSRRTQSTVSTDPCVPYDSVHNEDAVKVEPNSEVDYSLMAENGHANKMACSQNYASSITVGDKNHENDVTMKHTDLQSPDFLANEASIEHAAHGKVLSRDLKQTSENKAKQWDKKMMLRKGKLFKDHHGTKRVHPFPRSDSPEPNKVVYIEMQRPKRKKAYICHICGNAFRSAGLVEQHERVHTGEKPFSCDTCGKKFTFEWNLKTHTRTHTGEKPYPCHVCGKSFAVVSNLRAHTKIHTGEKPFTCPVCEKGFTQNRDLNKHLLTHSNFRLSKHRL